MPELIRGGEYLWGLCEILVRFQYINVYFGVCIFPLMRFFPVMAYTREDVECFFSF